MFLNVCIEIVYQVKIVSITMRTFKIKRRFILPTYLFLYRLKSLIFKTFKPTKNRHINLKKYFSYKLSSRLRRNDFVLQINLLIN